MRFAAGYVELRSFAAKFCPTVEEYFRVVVPPFALMNQSQGRFS